MGHCVKISVIICTHNRAKYLKKAIESLVNQTLSKEQYEIIVVDNASVDNTRKAIERLSGNTNINTQTENRELRIVNLRYIYEPMLGLSRARNTGWQNAKGEYVAYLDDDAIASTDWLENILDTFGKVNPNPGCIGGKVEPMWTVQRPAWISDKLLGQLTILDWGPEPVFLGNEQWFVGANMAFPKSILQETGGFQVNLGRIGNKLLSMEEVFLRKELEKREYKCFYHPQILVKHYILPQRLTKKWFLDRAYWNGASSGIMDIHERSLSILKRFFKGLATILRILSSPKEMFCLMFPKNDPERFAVKCSVLARIGHVMVLWGFIR